MRIAAAVDSSTDLIMPLPHSDRLLIYDADSGRVERHANPALLVERNRRAAVVRFVSAHDVQAVCCVPDALCTSSYLLATRSGLRFIQLTPGTRFADVIAQAPELFGRATLELPPDSLAPHGIACGKVQAVTLALQAPSQPALRS